MSTDARQISDSAEQQNEAQPQIAESAEFATEPIEVLMRLPDLRSPQSGAESISESPQTEDRGNSTGSGSDSASLFGPIFDTLRHRWSTWKNAAMFAQAGVISRGFVVGGLMLGMVIAAYVLMNRKQPSTERETETPNTAQKPASPEPRQPDIRLAAPARLPSHGHAPSLEKGSSSNWASVQLDNSSTTPAPKAHPETKAGKWNMEVVRPAVEVREQPRRRRQVYSADSRNRAGTSQPTESSNIYGDHPAARSAQQPNRDRFDNAASHDYRNSSERYRSSGSSDRSFHDGYRGSYPNSRYAPSNNNSNSPTRAGFRGTIEPAPYRSR